MSFTSSLGRLPGGSARGPSAPLRKVDTAPVRGGRDPAPDADGIG
ncbi:hypothetical protein [Streptomyces sp. NPDC101166]